MYTINIALWKQFTICTYSMSAGKARMNLVSLVSGCIRNDCALFKAKSYFVKYIYN